MQHQREIDTSRWIPLTNKEDFLRGYFDYLDIANEMGLPISDSNLKRARFFSLAAWVEASSFQLIGDVAECGCYFGHSTFMIAHILRRANFIGSFHIFDSFSGLSRFDQNDLTPLSPDVPQSNLEKLARLRDDKGIFVADEESVKQVLKQFNFIHIHKGWIPQRFEAVTNSKFAFVCLDLDIYAPTRDSLEFFYQRLVDGGFLWVDDYGLNTWPGATTAVDEFVVRHGLQRQFIRNPFGGAFLRKSGG